MTAVIDEHAQFLNSDGLPLVNGKIYFGTVNADPVANPVTIYSDRALSTPLANPQTLDAYGRATNKVWLAGKYSLQVNDVDDVQVYQSLDNGTSELDLGRIALTSISGANNITASTSDGITEYVDKQEYVLTTAQVNTSAVTIDIDSVGPKSVLKNGSQNLFAGEFKANKVIILVYNAAGDHFDWVNQSQPIFGHSAETTNFTVVLSNRGRVFDCTAEVTASIAAASTLDNGFVFTIKANGADVTIDPNGVETINGQATFVVPDGYQAEVVCDGSNFHTKLTGIPSIKVNTQASDYRIDRTDWAGVVNFTGLATAELDPAATLTNGWWCIIRASGGNVTIDPDSTETIDGETTYLLAQGTEALIQCDGSNFNIVLASDKGWVTLEERTVSAASEEDFLNLSAVFAEYEVVGRNVTVTTDGADVQGRVSTDNGSTFSTTNYSYAVLGFDAQGANENDAAASTTHYLLAGDVGNAANEATNFEARIYEPSATRHTFIKVDATLVEAAGNLVTKRGSGRWADTSAVDAFRVLVAAGTFSGTLILRARRT